MRFPDSLAVGSEIANFVNVEMTLRTRFRLKRTAYGRPDGLEKKICT